MKQSLVIHVRGCPDHSNAHWTAIQLAQAWMSNGHTLHSIFFSGAAASIAHRYRLKTGHNTPLQSEWQALTCPLVICVNAGRHFGILSAQGTKQDEGLTDTLAEHFTIGGLGSLADAKKNASKCIELIR